MWKRCGKETHSLEHAVVPKRSPRLDGLHPVVRAFRGKDPFELAIAEAGCYGCVTDACTHTKSHNRTVSVACHALAECFPFKVEQCVLEATTH